MIQSIMNSVIVHAGCLLTKVNPCCFLKPTLINSKHANS